MNKHSFMKPWNNRLCLLAVTMLCAAPVQAALPEGARQERNAQMPRVVFTVDSVQQVPLAQANANGSMRCEITGSVTAIKWQDDKSGTPPITLAAGDKIKAVAGCGGVVAPGAFGLGEAIPKAGDSVTAWGRLECCDVKQMPLLFIQDTAKQ
jgi:hypothetical protein